MQKIKEIAVDQFPSKTSKLLNFAKVFSHAAILQSNDYEDSYGAYNFIAAFGARECIQAKGDFFEELNQKQNNKSTWWFGHLSYDLKNQVEKLDQIPKQNIPTFDLAGFFEPKILFLQKRNTAIVELWGEPHDFDHLINDYLNCSEDLSSLNHFPKLQAVMDKQEYLDAIEKVKREIQVGNVYELNYCQEFNAVTNDFSPYRGYLTLQQRSPMPFAAFYKVKSAYLLSASPERYLRKIDRKIISQPIKGTYKRGADAEEDGKLKVALKQDPKEQNENVMIVDLVRNDLSRTAEKNTVQVEELFGVYTFPQVHQLISTVSSSLAREKDVIELLRTTFPMGSMTGAPKISAMNIIEREEKSARNLYSGTIGYMSPEGDMDFNVVIRSLLYQAENKILSLSVGGAITDLCNAESEYEECLLKAKAIMEKND